MCSVTHYRCSSGILVTMNRDEDRRRISEVPPQIHTPATHGCWMAPADGEPPNTWIAVNQSGFGGCILNRYQDSTTTLGEVSRGTLLPTMLEQTNPSELAKWLPRIVSAKSFSPFTLIAISRERTTRFDWTGQKLLAPQSILSTDSSGDVNDAPWALTTSSSWRSRSVSGWRSRQFRLWLQSGAPFRGDIPAFHLLQPDSLEAWAPLMSRRLSSTRSLTQIHVDLAHRRVVMRYWAPPHPGSRVPSCHLTLPLEETGSRTP